MSIIKRFMSPLNFDRYSYAMQCQKMISCTIPLMTLGYIYSVKLGIFSLIVFGIVGILFLGAMFAKKKICPRWLRDTVSDGLFSFILCCLPATIYACSGNNDIIYFVFEDRRSALIFGFICWLILLICDTTYNWKAKSRREAYTKDT